MNCDIFKKMVIKIKNILFATLITFIVYFFLCCIFHIDIFALPDYFYYIFNKDKEIISIDKEGITVKHKNSKYYDSINCNFDYSELNVPQNTNCIIDKKIEYLAVGINLYNSFNPVNVILNDKTVIKATTVDSSSEIFTNEIYRNVKFYVKMDTKQYKLKQGLNKIAVNGNNKIDMIYIYYNYKS